MKGFGRLCIFVLLLPTSSIVNAKPDAITVIRGDAAAGKFKSEDQCCEECHGSGGNGEQSERKYAKLVGNPRRI